VPRSSLRSSKSQLALCSPSPCSPAGLQSSKSQLELNAEQKIRTLAKLQRDSEALRRKSMHVTRTSQNCRAANQSKAQRVAEHSRKSEMQAEARHRSLMAEDATRQATVGQRQADERQRWHGWGERLENNICKISLARDAMAQAREERIRKKLEDDEEKLRRKAQHLQSVSSSRQLANLMKSEKVAEHQRQFAGSQEELLRQLVATDAARSSCVRSQREHELQRLETTGSHRDSTLAEAARVRQQLQQAAEQRTAEKLLRDSEAVLRKSQHLENETQRLHRHNRSIDEKVEKARYYERVVENARRSCDLSVH